MFNLKTSSIQTLLLCILVAFAPSVLSAEEAANPKEQKVLGNVTKGSVFIVSAPAGTGKTTLVQMLVKEFPSVVASVSYTTRQPRPGEISGIHYHFIDEATFKQKIDSGEFLEYVELYGNYYGTSRKKVLEQQQQGKHVILVIDTQGGLQLKGKVEATFIFIQPKGIDVLRERLTGRGTETAEVIEKRLSHAEREMQQGKQYDYQVVNDNLETAYDVLRSIIIAEEHRQ